MYTVRSSRHEKGDGDKKHRRSSVQYITESLGSTEISDRPSIRTKPKDLQATFENVVSVMQLEQGDSFTKSSVIDMVKSIYNWMVFDPDMQIVLPVTSNSSARRRMWPHGSKIDTRKRKDSSIIDNDPRRLRDVEDDCTSVVASSVISSSPDETTTVMPVGSILDPRAMYRVSSVMESPQMYHQSMYPQPLNYQQPASYQQHQAGQYYQPNVIEVSPQATYVSAQQQERPAAGKIRYSMTGVVQPPERVQETPQPQVVQAAVKKRVKRTRVGVTARDAASVDDGVDVVWED